MTEDREPEAWCPCPIGTVSRMLGHVRMGQRRQFLRALAKGSAAVVLLGTGGVVAAQWMLHEEKQLSCKEVVELLPDYVSHQLDEDLSKRVADHLAVCPPCQAHYEEMVG